MPGIFFRVPAILDGRYEVTAPRQRNDPDFPLRGYVRCETCGKPFTASWSKGRSDYYAYTILQLEGFRQAGGFTRSSARSTR